MAKLPQISQRLTTETNDAAGFVSASAGVNMSWAIPATINQVKLRIPEATKRNI